MKKIKVYEFTLIRQIEDGSLETREESFGTPANTKEAAIRYAREWFPDYIIVPGSISLKPRGLFWFGAAVGFAIAFILVSIAAGYFAYKLSH